MNAVFGKQPWFVIAGTLATSDRCASANACRVAPSPYAQSAIVSATRTSVAASVAADHGQGLLMVCGIPRKRGHGGNELALGVHRDLGLMPVKALRLALAAVPHLGVMDRGHPVLGHPLLQCWPVLRSLNVLGQHPAQQPRRLRQRLIPGTVRFLSAPGLPDQLQHAVGLSHHLLEEAAALLRVVPVDSRLPFEALLSPIAAKSFPRRPPLQVLARLGRQHPQHLPNPVRQ